MTERRALAMVVVGAALSGVLLGATFAGPVPRVVAPLGLAGLVLATHGRTPRAAVAASLAFGLGFMGLTLGWMWPSLGFGAWLGLTVIQCLWFVLVGLGMTVVGRLPGWPCWTAATWTSVELLRTSWPWGGVPWGRLAYSTLDTPWAAALPWLGVTGATFLVALLGSALAAIVLHAQGRGPRAAPSYTRVVPVALVLVALCAVLSSSFGRSVALASTSTSGSVRVGLVQGGVPGSGTRVVEHHREVTDNHAVETSRLVGGRKWAAAPAAFVLWPENATAVDPAKDGVARGAVEGAVSVADVPVLVGSVTDGPTSSTARNQLVAWTADGAGQRYTKQHLVPFGEYVPMRGLATRVSERVAEIGRDMVPGPPASPLSVAGLRLATALCFDVAYDDVVAGQVREGADLVVVSTSNAMFLDTAQLEQQWTISRVRALETGRSVVVASINGISGAIGPDGSVRQRFPERETTSDIVEVPVREGLTLAVRVGLWPGRVIMALTAAAVVASALSRRRRAALLGVNYYGQ